MDITRQNKIFMGTLINDCRQALAAEFGGPIQITREDADGFTHFDVAGFIIGLAYDVDETTMLVDVYELYQTAGNVAGAPDSWEPPEFNDTPDHEWATNLHLVDVPAACVRLVKECQETARQIAAAETALARELADHDSYIEEMIKIAEAEAERAWMQTEDDKALLLDAMERDGDLEFDAQREERAKKR